VADKSELQHIPRAVDALVLSEARSSLIARASDAGKTIMARKPDPALRAKVKMNGRWGLIDKNGRFAVEPFCCDIRDFSCGMAAFSDVPVQRSKRLYQNARASGATTRGIGASLISNGALLFFRDSNGRGTSERR